MALIKMSSVGITAISGKAGGSVYSRNRGGEYVKNFVMPTNTITQARQAVRSIFGSLASAWRTLTQSERNTWIEQAPNYLKTNAFGDKKQLQPNALFVGQNTNLLNAGLVQINEITAPQGTNTVLSEVSNDFDIGSGNAWTFDFDLESNQGAVGTPNEYVLEAAPPHSASKRNVQNEYRILRSTAGSDGLTPPSDSLTMSNFAVNDDDMKPAYEAKFGEPKAGDIVSIRIYAINPSTGERSAYFYSDTTVISTT